MSANKPINNKNKDPKISNGMQKETANNQNQTFTEADTMIAIDRKLSETGATASRESRERLLPAEPHEKSRAKSFIFLFYAFP